MPIHYSLYQEKQTRTGRRMDLFILSTFVTYNGIIHLLSCMFQGKEEIVTFAVHPSGKEIATASRNLMIRYVFITPPSPPLLHTNVPWSGMTSNLQKPQQVLDLANSEGGTSALHTICESP